MPRPGRWISLLPILALIPRLGLVIVAADRQQVAPGTRAALLWLSSVALAVLVGLAELYVGAWSSPGATAGSPSRGWASRSS